MRPMLNLLLLLTLLVWIMVLCCCANRTVKTNPAKQQKVTTSQQPIPVNQIDLNQDGVIDTTEQQHLTDNTPSVLGTFMCIGGATILICLGSAWICRRSHSPPVAPTTKPSDQTDDLILERDFDGIQGESSESSEVTDGGDWLDSGQDFDSGGKHR